MMKALSCLLLGILFLLPTYASADMATYDLRIVDHKFIPPVLRVRAHEKFKLIVKNEDTTPEEFESHDLNREKIIPGKSEASFYIGPLNPGSYHFFGEFNEDSAKGDMIAE